MPDSACSEPGSRVSDPQHARRLLRVLRGFWQEQSFHDALLVVDGEELPVQKNLLAAASPYIRTKLNYNPPKDDGSTYRIELQGVSMGTMKQILDFIFSGEITLRAESIQDVVQASDLLLMTDLKALCCQFLEGCISAENCIGIRLFALHYCLQHVHHVATEFLHTHFRDVARTEEFRELQPERLCELLAMEKLNVGSEKHVLEAVVRWFSHDPEGRRGRMREVMSAVWLQGLHRRYLREQEEPLTREVISFVEQCGVDVSFLREQAAQQPLMREVIREFCQPVLTRRRLHGRARLAASKPRGYSECIVIAGGEDRLTRRLTAATRCMCPLYDAGRQAWIELQPMGVARLGHGLVAAGGFLFAMGGTDEHNTVLGSGEKYDPDSNTWSPIPPMLQARHHFGAVELDGLIYALGGENEGAGLVTVEVFDPYFNTWRMQTSMTVSRKGGCYASMNKKVYAIGGASYRKLFDSVECFDPRTQQWTGLCPLMESRLGSVACGFGQELYVFGGARSQEHHSLHMTNSKSEFYDDEIRRWMFLLDQNLCMQASCSLVYGAVPIGGSIYVVGQLDTGTTFDYIREFRRSTETWHPTKQMSRSDLAKTACAKLRIANCCLLRLQLSQGMFRIQI